jgi:hypothetical protein
MLACATDGPKAFTAATLLLASATTFDPVLGGVTITGGGVFKSDSGFNIGRDFFLDASGNADAVFIFLAPTAKLEVYANGKMSLVNGAKAENVFWIINELESYDSNPLYGNFLVASTINLRANIGKIEGRLLGQKDVICFDACIVETVGGPTISPTVAPTATPTGGPTISPTVAPTTATTGGPTISPAVAPTAAPTGWPTISPTVAPTAAPT